VEVRELLILQFFRNLLWNWCFKNWSWLSNNWKCLFNSTRKPSYGSTITLYSLRL